MANYLELRSIAPALPIIPVLQGWRLADYLAQRGLAALGPRRREVPYDARCRQGRRYNDPNGV